jgi:hypothetical protein
MTTKLDKKIVRETCQVFMKRRVVVTLCPATPPDVEKCTPGLPERVEFHLKGTRQRGYIPLQDLFVKAIRGDSTR